MTHAKKNIQELAVEVFVDREKAEEWLITPIEALNNQTPSSQLENANGIEEVRVILQKIERDGFP